MSLPNVLIALEIAERLLALVASAQRVGGDVSDADMAKALTKAQAVRDKWYSPDTASTDD